MAEQEVEQQQQQQESDEHHDDVDAQLGYKVPADKSINEILQTDQEDESLKKYKEQLLGSAAQSSDLIFFPEDPRRVIVKQLALVVEGRPDETLDLTGDLKHLKDTPFCIKEGTKYKMKVSFNVQREIVTGLKYVQTVYRKGLKVDKNMYMVGSYAPKAEAHEFKCTEDEAPSGMIGRGEYRVDSLFTDDDKNKYLEWTWTLKVSKDWKENKDTK